MKTIVQKFGGTSLGSGERLHGVADIIQRTMATHRVVAVVSAMSGSEKAGGTTSLLLQASELAARGEPFWRVIRILREQHLAALASAAGKPALRKEVEKFIHGELERLQGFLKAIQVMRLPPQYRLGPA